jgi:[protein-PII] uridylyltransferase
VRLFSTPGKVTFASDKARGRTVMEIVTGDRPGLAAQIGRVLLKLDIYIRMAKLVTVGERAEDVFYITNDQYQTLSDAEENTLRDALMRAIDESD